jgi:hypothetical protein
MFFWPWMCWWKHIRFTTLVVATLAFGLRPKQGFVKLRAKREAGSHTTYSRECEKVWGNEPSHPKGVSLWELESRWTFESSEGNCSSQKSMAWRVIYIIKKLLELRYLKWAHIAHLNIWNISYGQKKGWESNWQFDSRPLKVKNRPDFRACKWRATYRWKAFDEGYNVASDVISIKGLHAKLWRPKVAGVPTLAISKLPLWSLETKSHLDLGPVERCRIYYKGEGGGFPQVRAVVSLVCPCCPWLVLTPKVLQLCINHLVLVLCRSVWVNKTYQLFLVPSRSSSMPLYPSKVLRAKERALTPYSSIIFCLGFTFESLKELGVHHWSYNHCESTFVTWSPHLYFNMVLSTFASTKSMSLTCCN